MIVARSPNASMEKHAVPHGYQWRLWCVIASASSHPGRRRRRCRKR